MNGDTKGSGRRPRLLDLFCGAGGCTKGFQRVGFEVVGVDIAPQWNYCGDDFIQMDALEFMRRLLAGERIEGWVASYVLSDFVVINASCPCQAYSALKGLTTTDYPKLIEPTRELLQATGLPFVIENVVGAPLRNPIRLCGSSFGLRVWRHRLFEMSHPPTLVPPCSHHHHPLPLDVTGTGGPSSKPRTTGNGGLSRKPASLKEAREAMGIDWMSRAELAEAIPPAFTEFVGAHLMAEVEARVRA